MSGNKAKAMRRAAREAAVRAAAEHLGRVADHLVPIVPRRSRALLFFCRVVDRLGLRPWLPSQRIADYVRDSIYYRQVRPVEMARMKGEESKLVASRAGAGP